MSGAAIAMMIVAILIIWGGLGFALLNLYKHPETDTGDSDEAPRTFGCRRSIPPHRNGVTGAPHLARM